MLAGSDSRPRMANADRGIACRFHHNVDIAGYRLRIIGRECRGRDPFGVPANGAAGFARTLRIEVDDKGHLKPRRMRYLRQEH